MEFMLIFGVVGDFLVFFLLINDIRLVLDDCCGLKKIYCDFVESLMLF